MPTSCGTPGIEETAIGAAIGIIALVLPTSTRDTISHDTREFLSELSGLIGHVADAMLGRPPEQTTIAEARELDQRLQTLRKSATPLAHGIAGVAGRSHIRRGLRVMMACDHYARSLARLADPVPDEGSLHTALGDACARVRANVDALGAMLDDHQPTSVNSAQPALEAAEDALHRLDGLSSWTPADSRRVLGTLRYLLRIDQSVVGLAKDLSSRIGPAAAGT